MREGSSGPSDALKKPIKVSTAEVHKVGGGGGRRGSGTFVKVVNQLYQTEILNSTELGDIQTLKKGKCPTTNLKVKKGK